MSTIRIIFIIVCLIVAVLVFTVGFVFQKNGAAGGLPAGLFGTRSKSSARKRKPHPKNSGGYLTIFLILVLLVLIIVFSGGLNH